MDEMAKWYNSFIIVPKPSDTIHQYPDLARLDQANRGPTLNDILPN